MNGYLHHNVAQHQFTYRTIRDRKTLIDKPEYDHVDGKHPDIDPVPPVPVMNTKETPSHIVMVPDPSIDYCLA